MEIGVAGAGTAYLDQDLPRPGFWHRDVAKPAWLLPLDEPEGLHGGG